MRTREFIPNAGAGLGRRRFSVVVWTMVGFALYVGGCVDTATIATEEKPSGTLLYVATNGNDAWSGTMPDPTADKGDGPFATIERARDEVRAMKKRGPLRAGGVTVLVRGGVYYVSKTVNIGAEDSGTAEAPVVYRSVEGEKVVLVGGRLISGFVPHKGEILEADVGAQGFKGIYFRQLFLNGQRQHLARRPNFDPVRLSCGGWAYVDGDVGSIYKSLPNETKRDLHCKEGDLREWARPEEGEVNIYPRYNWGNCIVPIASVDKAGRIITLAKDTSKEVRPGDRYYIRNLFEELDSPGEWYLDKQTWTLYFWPPAPIEKTAICAPMVQALFEMGAGAAHVTVRGFTIECCDGTPVVVRGATDCLVAANKIHNANGSHGSEAGVFLDDGSRNGAVGNDISDIGNCGILIAGGDRKTLTPAGNYAENNYIHHIGCLNGHGCGVMVHGVGNRVAHNLIHDTSRCGVFGGGNDHVIEFNHIRHANLQTEDTGGIYVCAGQEGWMRRGMVIRHNFLHDILGFGRKGEKWVSPHYACGIYLDDAISGVTVYGNIVARTPLGGTFIHGGRDNVLENNILVDGAAQQMIWSGSPPPQHAGAGDA